MVLTSLGTRRLRLRGRSMMCNTPAPSPVPCTTPESVLLEYHRISEHRNKIKQQAQELTANKQSSADMALNYSNDNTAVLLLSRNILCMQSNSGLPVWVHYIRTQSRGVEEGNLLPAAAARSAPLRQQGHRQG